MASNEKRNIIRVFLASPGDLGDERRAAKDIVDEINALIGKELRYFVELVGWEDTVSAFGRAQAIINEELNKCELVVGLVWKHWGTPPATDSIYASGFEEEYTLSVKRREETGTPEISIFLKDVDPAIARDPGDQLKKVLEFKSKLIAEKKLLFETFADGTEFQKKFRKCRVQKTVLLPYRGDN